MNRRMKLFCVNIRFQPNGNSEVLFLNLFEKRSSVVIGQMEKTPPPPYYNDVFFYFNNCLRDETMTNDVMTKSQLNWPEQTTQEFVEREQAVRVIQRRFVVIIILRTTIFWGREKLDPTLITVALIFTHEKESDRVKHVSRYSEYCSMI